MLIPNPPPDHRVNRRDDGHTNFEDLKRRNRVLDMEGREIGIDEPHNIWSALDRDRLFQAYCSWFSQNDPGERQVRRWIRDQEKKLKMSPQRARDIINEGCGGWAKKNSMWWRGVSL